MKNFERMFCKMNYYFLSTASPYAEVEIGAENMGMTLGKQSEFDRRKKKK